MPHDVCDVDQCDEPPIQTAADVEEDDEPPGGQAAGAIHESLRFLSGSQPLKFPLAAPPAVSRLQTRDWNSWQWQLSRRFRNLEELAANFPSLSVSPNMMSAAARFPMAITPYYASLIQRFDDSDPIFRMAIPVSGELFDPPFLMEDPLEEDHDMPVPGLVHRYRDRALLLATSMCAMYCRHCTRKRLSGQQESSISPARLEQIVRYLSSHPEIRDVIVSGGDPLTLSDVMLERVIAAVRAVPSVEIIRIGTRAPVTLPMRITPSLVKRLRRYQPLWVNTHFNHPNELTTEAAAACARLVDAGIPMGNQTVLLRGVNDDPRTMETLLRELVRIRVRPYYLYQCDLVRGIEHFRTPISRGIEIMEYLRGRLSGFAIPTYVVDAPGGGGKIPVLPTYIVSQSPTHTVLRNFEGMLVSYPEPGNGVPATPRNANGDAPTVFDLARGAALKIEPAGSDRLGRRTSKRPSSLRMRKKVAPIALVPPPPSREFSPTAGAPGIVTTDS